MAEITVVEVTIPGLQGAAGGVATPLNLKTASYTLVIGNANETIEMNVASANTLTVPPDASVDFDDGTYLNIVQIGAGQTTITAGAGVTIRNRSGLKLSGQYAVSTIYKRGANEWVACGDLTS